MDDHLEHNGVISQEQAPAALDADERDRGLIERIARERDLRAMEAIYVDYRPRLAAFLQRLTHDASLIEETYNDVMLQVWNKAGQYEARAKVSSWVFTIAYRRCLKLLRRQTVRERLFDRFNESVHDRPEPHANGGDEREMITVALQRLSAKHRLVIELCYFQGYSIAEIAVIAGCPPNTVKTRLHHARKKLRALVDDLTTADIQESPSL